MVLVSARTAILPLICLLATACATSPMDTSAVSSRATPSQAVESMSELAGKRIQWGGQIISIRNKERTTLVEVLSYPVGGDGVPDTRGKPTGRFLLRREGFLEPRDYASGRFVTTVGTVESLVKITVEETELVIPLIHAEQLKLWEEGYGHPGREPRFGFGVGIGIGL